MRMERSRLGGNTIPVVSVCEAPWWWPPAAMWQPAVTTKTAGTIWATLTKPMRLQFGAVRKPTNSAGRCGALKVASTFAKTVEVDTQIARF